jgi:hypothetical protein
VFKKLPDFLTTVAITCFVFAMFLALMALLNEDALYWAAGLLIASFLLAELGNYIERKR